MSTPGNGPFAQSASQDVDRKGYSNFTYNNYDNGAGISNPAPITQQPAAGYAPPTAGYAPPTAGYAPPTAPAYQYSNHGYQTAHRGHNVVTTVPSTMIIQQPGGLKPPDYIALAVVTTVMCNFLCGGIAVIFSMMSSNAWNRGDAVAARSHGKTSLVLSIFGIVSGIGIVVFIVIYYTVIFSAVFKF